MKKNSQMKAFIAVLAFLAGGMAVGTAQAGHLLGEFRPEIHGEIEVETQFNRVYNVDKRQPGTHNTSVFSECDDCIFRLGLFPELAIALNIGAAPEREELETENVLYQDMEMFAEELYIQYSSSNLVRSGFIDEVGFFGGKFNPVFGLVNGGMRTEFEFPGIFSEEFPEKYELKEMLGVGAEITFSHHHVGVHTLRASTFYKDNSFLQSAFPAYRERSRVFKGGVANTGTPQSWSVNLAGEDLPIGGLKYELGFRFLESATQYAAGAVNAAGQHKNVAEHDDVGVAAGLIYNKAFFLPRKTFRPWLLALIYSRQDIHVPWTPAEIAGFDDNTGDEADVNKSVGDDLYEVNLGYRFNHNWLLQGSWALTEEYEDQTAKEQGVFAIELDYQFVF